jgi:YHS domain-containing protein
MKRQYKNPCFKDPVCGMEISRLTAIEMLVYQGKEYYFCAGICRKAFEAQPEMYIPRHRQHGIKSTQIHEKTNGP